MIPRTIEGQIVNITDGSHAAEPSGKRPIISSSDQPRIELRDRISATVRVAREQRELELRQASERAAIERQEIQQRATEALLSLLSDDVLNLVIGKHAGMGEPPLGTIKITKHGIELIRGGGAGAAQMSGEKLDIKFDGALLPSVEQLKSTEIQNRVRELQVQGLKIEGIYDASGQSILLTFDYGKALC